MNPRNLLWIDCTAGAVAGALMLILRGWLSTIEGLPLSLVTLLGAANCLYALYSFSLAVRPKRKRSLINLLIFANFAWAVVCVVLAIRFFAEATMYGIAHLAGEAVFVGQLAILEWRNRAQLLTRA